MANGDELSHWQIIGSILGVLTLLSILLGLLLRGLAATLDSNSAKLDAIRGDHVTRLDFKTLEQEVFNQGKLIAVIESRQNDVRAELATLAKEVTLLTERFAIHVDAKRSDH